MPLVTIDMWEGRTVEQKRQLVKDITAAVCKMGPPPESVTIILRDVPKHNWATAGNLSCDAPPHK